ncbi:uroporphyrinogen decarboxylase family protein [Sediminispirochaeta smaragdinae]|uniref:Uroporphyrinogen decarboxylase (URO-D) domain-containing protein n=1 Tax=Sediminispirochaeta smaragdinae (strain DSM 11293 / JCM 15392 / SEBR 4228) TaxID=573413 RepID=E1R2B1_SEDSS|nr:uroporphyrinogen decarboxylase family protein [Sediminispirochaeta smaragdinae]ADK82471.1 conserved hypothetical protein [Sediminispirochaeta smaragdinae DSM 11293]
MTYRENTIIAYRHGMPLWTPNVIVDCNVTLQSSVNERYEGQTSGSDEFGVQYTFIPQVGAPIVTPGTEILTDISAWKKQIRFPDVDSYDWEAGSSRDTANWDREKFSVVQLFNGPFERLHALMGFENALIALLEYPSDVFEFFEAFTEYRIKMYKKIAQYYKPDSIMVFDDYGADHSMLLSPDCWRTLIKPHIKKAIDTVHDLGIFYTLHSCGFIRPIFKDIVEMGADAIHPMQYVNDAPALKKEYGRHITFTGGFDNIGILDNPGAEPEDIRKEVRRVLQELAADGSYVAWQTVLSKEARKIFLDEIMQHSAPKMTTAGIEPPDWTTLIQ